MRAFIRHAALASAITCMASPLVLATSAFAQVKTTDQQAADAAPKQVALTQKEIDGVVAAQKQIRAIDEKVPQDAGNKPDPKIDAELDAVAKKNGFSSLAEFSNVSASIGFVMAGVDPETKKYVGPTAVLDKQINEVQADKKMPPKEKKEALGELDEAKKSVSTEKPLPGNVDLVTANYDKLTASMQEEQ